VVVTVLLVVVGPVVVTVLLAVVGPVVGFICKIICLSVKIIN
jgi:hypothetical protein